MKKLFAVCFLLTSSLLYSGVYEKNSGTLLGYKELVYDNFVLNLSAPEWQPRVYYYGIVPSSIGYFYVNNRNGNIGIYGSNRYVLEDNFESFFLSLHPLEVNLLPYATPNAGSQSVCRLISEANTPIAGIPAKQLIFEIVYPNHPEEIIISYIFTKPVKDKILGYTYSVSCSKGEFEKHKNQIGNVIAKLQMR